MHKHNKVSFVILTPSKTKLRLFTGTRLTTHLDYDNDLTKETWVQLSSVGNSFPQTAGFERNWKTFYIGQTKGVFNRTLWRDCNIKMNTRYCKDVFEKIPCSIPRCWEIYKCCIFQVALNLDSLVTITMEWCNLSSFFKFSNFSLLFYKEYFRVILVPWSIPVTMATNPDTMRKHKCVLSIFSLVTNTQRSICIRLPIQPR